MADGTCTMHAGEGPSMWSNWVATEALVSAGIDELPAPDRSVDHVVASQSPSGGIGWGPAWAAADQAEMRAAGFALRWMGAIGRREDALDELDREALAAWILEQQDDTGGFRLKPTSATPCLWATAEALDVLDALDAADRGVIEAAVDFALGNRMADDGFRRGTTYDHSDLWSTRNGVRTLERAGALDAEVADGAADYLTACESPRGGATYRPGTWAEAYTTAAGLIAKTEARPDDAVDFLHQLRMPEDGGIAYMPGRGAEARALRLAGLAAATHGRPLDATPSMTWAVGARNPDGGWGVFDGRSSAANTTCAVLAAAEAVEQLDAVVTPELVRWTRHRWLAARRAPLDLVELSLLSRIAAFTGSDLPHEPLQSVLVDHEVVDGGWSRHAGDGPDLHSTYQALLATQVLGTYADTLDRSARWVRTLERPAGVAWSPLSSEPGGPLAAALAELVHQARYGNPLPDLAL